MLVERDSGDAAMTRHIVVNVPCIKSSISRAMGGEAIEGNDRVLVYWAIVGDIVLVERLSIFGQHHIPIASNGGRSDAGAIAPTELFFLFGRSIGLLLVRTSFDTELAIGITCQDLCFVIALFDIDPFVVFLDGSP
jgi:hypothetical protein